MKKLILFLIGLFSTIILVACNTTTTTKITTTIGSTTATTISPNSPIYDIAPSSDMCENLEDIGDWKIAWCDEFNYRGLPDTKKWKYDTGGDGWGNNELQFYKAQDRDNVYVVDDNLVITALKERLGSNNYTSTRLNSAGKSEFLYGKIDIRAKLPGEKGTWPALWMLGNFGKYSWPGCGEIDIMEHVANDLNVIHGSIHTKSFNHKDKTQKTDKMILDDVVNEYHNYGIEWTPKQIRFFIDGENYFTFNNDDSNNHDNWPFYENMFFILNIAIGGWGGTVDPNFKEAKMYVDYVRVYQKDSYIDTASPEHIENLHAVTTTPTNSIIKWDATNDDMGIKYYDVFLNDVLQGKTEVPNYSLKNLEHNTTYQVKIVAYDFSGNSNEGSLTLTTADFPTIPGKIEAENFIQMQGIQLETTSDTGGGQNIGYTDVGDYMVYKINVPTSGTYKVSYRVASQSLGGTIDLFSNDVLLTKKSFSGTGGWQNWTSVETETFELNAGVQTIKLYISKSGFNINHFEFIKV